VGSPSLISPLGLYARSRMAGAPVLVDVRRTASFDADEKVSVGRLRRDPDRAAVEVGCCSRGRHETISSSINGRRNTRRPWPGAVRSSRPILYEQSYHLDYGARAMARRFAELHP
jgi:hypothetical protein